MGHVVCCFLCIFCLFPMLFFIGTDCSHDFVLFAIAGWNLYPEVPVFLFFGLKVLENSSRCGRSHRSLFKIPRYMLVQPLRATRICNYELVRNRLNNIFYYFNIYKLRIFLPAPSKISQGCCLNPKGWCFLAPLIIHSAPLGRSR